MSRFDCICYCLDKDKGIRLKFFNLINIVFQGLYGDTDFEQAKIDEIMDTAADFGPEIVKAIFSQDEAAKVKLQIKQVKNSVAFISNCLPEC